MTDCLRYAIAIGCHIDCVASMSRRRSRRRILNVIALQPNPVYSSHLNIKSHINRMGFDPFILVYTSLSLYN